MTAGLRTPCPARGSPGRDTPAAGFHVRFARRGEGRLAIDERAIAVEEPPAAAVEKRDGPGTPGPDFHSPPPGPG